ncbi:MAG: hypothetical protein H6733_16190, partial [Alphaproteobacteria bacterium]|nr:hypothetical protein [Alphaproteobacteria bacterium]
MKPTWASLAPILRGADCDEDQSWAVVLQHHGFLLGAVRRVVSRAPDVVATWDGRTDAAVSEAFQWMVERLVKRIQSDPPGLPVSEREDGSRGSAARWFFTVAANLARDWVKAQRRRLRREVEIPEHKPVSIDDEPPILWDDAALRKLSRLLERPERAGVPDTHVLAYVCLYRPESVDRQMVVRAHAYVPSAGSRSGQPGLFRDVETTWRALQGWRTQHGVDPFTAEARAELAWILRSSDDGPAHTWRDRDRRGARTATVTIGKWAIRCA